MRFHIETMTCGGCVRSVTKAIQAVDPRAAVEADLDRHDVSVTTTAPREAIVSALTDAGYEPA